MSKTVSTVETELADRAAIHDCLVFYTRGVDRRDIDLMRQAYWPDATDDHAMMPPMSAEDFINLAAAEDANAALEATQHVLSNVLIDIVGATAYVESYVTAYHRFRHEDGERRDLIAGARYIDRMEKRDDEWRIARRVVKIDWLREYDDSYDLANGFRGAQFIPGGRKPHDASYELLSHE